MQDSIRKSHELKNKNTLKYMLNKSKEIMSNLIRYLKLLPHKPRLWWHRLWIRKDEFHHSLDMDISAMMHMNKQEQAKYLQDLTRRRNIAHERDFQNKTKL